MRVLITGIDGYLGWSLAKYLAIRDHTIMGVDNLLRRGNVNEVGSHSVVPIDSLTNRAARLGVACRILDLQNAKEVAQLYHTWQPDAIVYLGEQPSAPYSMSSLQRAYATQANNVLGTLTTLHAMRECCPSAHLIKLGTMGEYGTPQCEIPEGTFPPGSQWIQHDDKGVHGRGSLDGLMFPRTAGSWYHLSKVHDSHNIQFACNAWDLRATDIMQGVVYGHSLPVIDDPGGDPTRLDVDQYFGTVVNRLCAQAVIGMPLTVYGPGVQRRGFLSLLDCMRCIDLILHNPPEAGEYRTVNQYAKVYSVMDWARSINHTAAVDFNLTVTLQHLANPRTEAADHTYTPSCSKLEAMGYKPVDPGYVLRGLLETMMRNRDRIKLLEQNLLPTVKWQHPMRLLP